MYMHVDIGLGGFLKTACEIASIVGAIGWSVNWKDWDWESWVYAEGVEGHRV
jgi:hypothetical protein